MKHLIFILGLLICSTNVYAQESSDLFAKVLTQLNFTESETAMNWATQKEILEIPDKSIVIIPKIAEEKENAYIILDAYILLVDSQTGKIEAKFIEKRAWISDAYILYDIEIQPEPYNLNEKTKAFGIILEYETDSRVNIVGSRKLSLFIQHGDSLKRVLKDYPIVFSRVRTNTRCESNSEIHSKEINITDKITNGYYDLKVIDNVTKKESTEENCESKVTSKSQNIEILEFRDGNYKKAP